MSKLTLKQMIINEIDNNPRGYAEELASLSGYSSGSALKKVLKDEKKEFEKFSSLLTIVETLFPDRVKELMSEYALTLDVKKQSSRFMLEFCEIHRLTETKEKLMDSMKNCGNSYSEEWENIYRIEHEFTKGEMSLNRAVSLYSSIKTKQPETAASIEIYKSYCYLQEKQYDMIYQSLLNVDLHIEEIKEPYIKEMYFARYMLLLISYNIRKGNVDEARKQCKMVLNEVNRIEFRCLANLYIGNSYIISDFDESYKYLIAGYEESKDKFHNSAMNLKRSLNFLHNVWNKTSPFLDLESNNPSDVHEIAFYYINNNQYTEAEKTLNSIDKETLTNNQKAFNCYLRALMSKDIDMFAESISYFQKSGDYFFMQLPLIQLKNLGIPDSIIKVMAHQY